MKRFAAHYLFLPEVGFLKQQVVEVSPEGVVLNFFPLTEEIESVEWLPGVIVLLSELDTKIQKNNGMIVEIIPLFEKNIEIHFKNHWIVSNQSSQCF